MRRGGGPRTRHAHNYGHRVSTASRRRPFCEALCGIISNLTFLAVLSEGNCFCFAEEQTVAATGSHTLAASEHVQDSDPRVPDPGCL